ncbi:hypothetical protein [Pseudomonas sp. AB12(2023)]|uniref:hypothetical protein n=1 Tax=Pseudomonas sp. AB12(2023) TaxID=3048597 RepID=UPI002B23A38D|nr:hypothetical protein [Pseudomonas sp. AB12(2023)]MEB0222065.1 hypothetical protein [Pseudomonas sp. AB12(2023)]
MDELGASFTKLLGRQPSDKEVEKLYRVKNALNIRDNDSLWLVLMALESYDTLYSKYPGIISSHVENALEGIRKTAAQVADAETKKALGSLSEAVSRTSEKVAVAAVAGAKYQALGLVTLGLVGFGALCTFVGFVLGTGKLPFWAQTSPGQHPFEIVLSTIARTPAGWIGALGGCTAVAASMWSARKEIRVGKRKDLVLGAVVLLALSAVYLAPFF